MNNAVWQGWLQAIPWIVAIIGWGRTHVFSELRERRKDVRALLDKAQGYLLALEKQGREFHSASQYSAEKGAELRLGIDVLERRFRRIVCLDSEALNPDIIAFRRSITLRNFDDSNFVSQSATSAILAEISNAAEDLSSAMEGQYNLIYPHKFPYFKRRRKSHAPSSGHVD